MRGIRDLGSGYPGHAAASPPVLDRHLHANAADSHGPPPLGVCLGLDGLPAWDQRGAWGISSSGWMKKPPCGNPIWSPATDDALRADTIAALHRRNVVGVLSGTPERVAR